VALERIPGLEMAIFARGRVEFAEKFADHDPQSAAVLTDAEPAIVYQRELRNLQTQEGRLRVNIKRIWQNSGSFRRSELPPPRFATIARSSGGGGHVRKRKWLRIYKNV
jgi:hypothetical protein